MAVTYRAAKHYNCDHSAATGEGCPYISGGYVVVIGGKDVVVTKFTNKDETKTVFVGLMPGHKRRVYFGPEDLAGLSPYKLT